MDILIDAGDWAVVKVSGASNGTSYYDISLESEEEAVASLVRRAITTPIRHLALYVPDANSDYGIAELDGGYGTAIYSRLGEAPTVSLLQQIQEDVRLAASKAIAPHLVISAVTLAGYTLDSVTVVVDYYYNNKFSQLTLTV